MLVSATTAVVVLVMMIMLVGMIVSTTAIVPMFMMVVMTASAIVIMMVMMGCDPSLKDHVDTGIVQCMENSVPQTILLHIEDGCHEGELRMPTRPHPSVEEDTFPQIREVHGNGGLVRSDCHLYVTHECSGFTLHPSSDIGEHVSQPCLHIRVESGDRTVDTHGDTACFLC